MLSPNQKEKQLDQRDKNTKLFGKPEVFFVIIYYFIFCILNQKMNLTDLHHAKVNEPPATPQVSSSFVNFVVMNVLPEAGV